MAGVGGNNRDEPMEVESIEERRLETYNQAALLNTDQFMTFCQSYLNIPNWRTLEYYNHGDLQDYIRYGQLQRAYIIDREEFLRNYPQDFADVSRSTPPDELPHVLAYCFLNRRKDDWLTFLLFETRLQISHDEIQNCRKVLRLQQKYGLLEHWLSQQDFIALENNFIILEDLLREFKSSRNRQN